MNLDSTITNFIIKGFQVNFTQKLVLLMGTFFTASIFRLSMLHKYYWVAVFCILSFILLTTLTINFVYTDYLKKIWFIVQHFRITQWLSAPLPEIVEIASKMGMKKNIKFGVRDDIETAYACRFDNSIVVSKDLFFELDKKQVLGAVAHEVAHLTSKLPLKYSLVLALAPVPIAFSLLGIPQLMIQIGGLSAMMLFMVPISWYEEMKADVAAAKIIGPDVFISVLKTLLKDCNPNEPSLSHPSLNERISNIEKEVI